MSKVIRIGLAGVGTVGAGVIKLLHTNAAHIARQTDTTFNVTCIAVRDPSKKRDVMLDGVDVVVDPMALVTRPDVDVIIEVMGGADGAALKLTHAALNAHKPVITANKAMLATHGAMLFDLVRDAKTPLFYEASVGGGMPVIKLFREGLAANKITAFAGILNGTCNYILTTMEQTGRAFNDVLAEAQKLGYAEADPAADIDGHDTAQKAAILTMLATGSFPDLSAMDITGIRDVTIDDIRAAAVDHKRIKLVAEFKNGVVRVAPVALPLDHPLASVNGVMNAVWYMADPVGEGMVMGRGAGAGPTASAIVADLMDLARRESLDVIPA